MEKVKSEGTMTRREVLVALVVSTVAACTSDRPTDEGGGDGEEVGMTNQLTFSPATLNISTGDTVTFRNTSSGGIIHTATCDPAKAANASHVALPAGAAVWDSGALAPGATFSHTFTTAGQYRYVCLPHESLGMLGTINVS